jgi:hypothetical protein
VTTGHGMIALAVPAVLAHALAAAGCRTADAPQPQLAPAPAPQLARPAPAAQPPLADAGSSDRGPRTEHPACVGAAVDLTTAFATPECRVGRAHAAAQPLALDGLRFEIRPASLRVAQFEPLRFELELINDGATELRLLFAGASTRPRAIGAERSGRSPETAWFAIEAKDARGASVESARNLPALIGRRSSKGNQDDVEVRLTPGGKATAKLVWRSVGYNQNRDYPAHGELPAPEPLDRGSYTLSIFGPLAGAEGPLLEAQVRIE